MATVMTPAGSAEAVGVSPAGSASAGVTSGRGEGGASAPTRARNA